MGRTPYRRAVAETRWVLFRVQQGEPEVIGVCSSDATARQRAHAIIAKTTGKPIGRPPQWYPLPTGGKLLTFGRDRYTFQFRAEPWIVDSEATV